MTNRRALSWSTALRDLRGERATRAAVREERLRATAGLRTGAGFSSWRGASGRRYVVGVRAVNAEAADVADAVLIAVRRGADGTAAILDAAAPPAHSSRGTRLRWLCRMRSRGATELHVHLLAESEGARSAVVGDLVASASS